MSKAKAAQTQSPKRPSWNGKQREKGWTNLTDPKKLRHIAKLVNGALNAAPTDGSMSLEDFKEFVEAYSEEHSKHPIVMDLCEGTDGEIRGFRFYLANNPKERTSGKYLALNLQKVGVAVEETKYTPSSFIEHLGIEAELSDLDDNFELEEDDLGLEDELSLDNGLNDFNFNTFTASEEELDDLLNDEEEPVLSDEATRKTPLGSTSKQQFAKQQTKQRRPSYQSSRSKSPAAQPPSASRSFYSRDPLEEVSDASGRVAISGSDVNGINAVGLTAQLATLGVVLSADAIESLQDFIEDLKKRGEEARLQRILETLQHENERVGKLTKRLHDTRSPIASPEELDRAEDIVENAVTTATSRLGDKVNQLGRDLDPNYKPLPPLKLNQEDDLNTRLDRIEQYLNQMVKHIDRLEQRIEKLEEVKLGEPRLQPSVESVEESGINTSPTGASPASSTVTVAVERQQESKDESELLKISQQKQQQQTACAESLVGFAVAANQHTGSTAEGISAFTDRTVFFEQEDDQTLISLEDQTDRQLFSATKVGQNWTMHKDELLEEDINTILRLPQTPEAYSIREATQAFVTTLQERLPDAFTGRNEPNFALSEQGEITYEFEITKSLKDKKCLLGFDTRNHNQQVFAATLNDAHSPTIEQCDIPLEVLEAVVGDRQESRSREQLQASSSKRNEKQMVFQDDRRQHDEMQA
jgi:hypothetical protein